MALPEGGEATLADQEASLRLWSLLPSLVMISVMVALTLVPAATPDFTRNVTARTAELPLMGLSRLSLWASRLPPFMSTDQLSPMSWRVPVRVRALLS